MNYANAVKRTAGVFCSAAGLIAYVSRTSQAQSQSPRNASTTGVVKFTTKSALNSEDITMILDPANKLECVVVDSFIDFRSGEGGNGINYDDVLATVLKRQSDFRSTPQGENIRSDSVLWVDTQSEVNSGVIGQLIDAMATLPSVLGSPGVKLALPRHIQLAHFDNLQSKYVAHRDNKPTSRLNIDDDAVWLSQPEQRCRFLTCVLYLTPPAPAAEWDLTVDGGGLRVFCGCDEQDDSGYSAQSVVDIAPCSGRLVLFASRSLLHEVLPTTRARRVALTAWLLDYPDEG